MATHKAYSNEMKNKSCAEWLFKNAVNRKAYIFFIIPMLH